MTKDEIKTVALKAKFLDQILDEKTMRLSLMQHPYDMDPDPDNKYWDQEAEFAKLSARLRAQTGTSDYDVVLRRLECVDDA